MLWHSRHRSLGPYYPAKCIECRPVADPPALRIDGFLGGLRIMTLIADALQVLVVVRTTLRLWLDVVDRLERRNAIFPQARLTQPHVAVDDTLSGFDPLAVIPAGVA